MNNEIEAVEPTGVPATLKVNNEELINISDKLISAYNYTYGKGINPEAVPDLYSALKAIFIDWQDEKADEIMSPDFRIKWENMKQAIKKSELKCQKLK